MVPIVQKFQALLRKLGNWTWPVLTNYHQQINAAGAVFGVITTILIAGFGWYISFNIDENEKKRSEIERSIAISQYILNSRPIQALNEHRLYYTDLKQQTLDRALASDGNLSRKHGDKLEKVSNNSVIHALLNTPGRRLPIASSLREFIRKTTTVHDCGAYDKENLENLKDKTEILNVLAFTKENREILCDRETLFLINKSDIFENFFAFRYAIYCGGIIVDGAASTKFNLSTLEVVVKDFLTRDGLGYDADWPVFIDQTERADAIAKQLIKIDSTNYSIVRETDCTIDPDIVAIASAVIDEVDAGNAKATALNILTSTTRRN